MPERTPREIAHELSLHRAQLVHDVRELENIVRYWLDAPNRLRETLKTVRLSKSAYVALGAGALLFGLGAFLARRR